MLQRRLIREDRISIDALLILKSLANTSHKHEKALIREHLSESVEDANKKVRNIVCEELLLTTLVICLISLQDCVILMRSTTSR